MQGKRFVLVTGGYSDGFKVENASEIFDIEANMWFAGTAMQTRRVAHSLCEVKGGKYVYAFGGQDGDLKPLKSIERVSFEADTNNPESSMSDWQTLDLQLPEPICNLGCLPISLNEVLLFGGISAGKNTAAKPLNKGRVMMILEQQHDLIDQEINLLAGDIFPNTMQYVQSTEQSHPAQRLVFIQGKTSMHRLDLTQAEKRHFGIEFEISKDGPIQDKSINLDINIKKRIKE